MLSVSTGKNLRRHSERQIVKTTGASVLIKVNERFTKLLQQENISEDKILEYVSILQQSRQYLFLNLQLLVKVIKYTLDFPEEFPTPDKIMNYFPSGLNISLNSRETNLIKYRYFFNFLRYYQHFMGLSKSQDN